jgi:hypothetical protein
MGGRQCSNVVGQGTVGGPEKLIVRLAGRLWPKSEVVCRNLINHG